MASPENELNTALAENRLLADSLGDSGAVVTIVAPDMTGLALRETDDEYRRETTATLIYNALASAAKLREQV